MTTAVSFQNVSRHFGSVRAVDDVTLTIASGEFFAMLGPSGSGKTTCLRLIAGFEQPTNGHIEIFGETAEGLPPYRRNVNTVFQDYALFPHMTILENVGYGLMVKGVPRVAREKKALETLDLVELKGFDARRPSQLSGGQRQRVALARALVNEPKVLLLDEPLGALDLKLREQMQVELKTLQRNLGITFVFVTHDQGEALSMADRVAIFNHGRIVQVGAPEDIYERPRNRFTLINVPGEPGAAQKADVEQGLEAFPDTRVQTRQEWIDKEDEEISQFLLLLYVLLALSVVISLFGMINTLALSVFERTRELGMLRAVGMTRRQTRRMVRHESVMVALIGAALGLPLGIFLALLVTQALAQYDLQFAIPTGALITFVVVSVIAGIVAAILPARRAARLRVLEALQYE